MLPIAMSYLPVSSLGIGGHYRINRRYKYPVPEITPCCQGISSKLCSPQAGGVLLIWRYTCIGLGIGPAKRDKGVAALAAVVRLFNHDGHHWYDIFARSRKLIQGWLDLVMGLTWVIIVTIISVTPQDSKGSLVVHVLCPIITAFLQFFCWFLFSLFDQLFQGGYSRMVKVLPLWAQLVTFFLRLLMRLSGRWDYRDLSSLLYLELGGTGNC